MVQYWDFLSRAVRGVPDVVCDGSTGLLAPPEDEPALSDLTRVLLVDEERRTQMGRNAAAFVAAERSIDSAATRIGLALADIVFGGPDRGTGAPRI